MGPTALAVIRTLDECSTTKCHCTTIIPSRISRKTRHTNATIPSTDNDLVNRSSSVVVLDSILVLLWQVTFQYLLQPVKRCHPCDLLPWLGTLGHKEWRATCTTITTCRTLLAIGIFDVVAMGPTALADIRTLDECSTTKCHPPAIIPSWIGRIT